MLRTPAVGFVIRGVGVTVVAGDGPAEAALAEDCAAAAEEAEAASVALVRLKPSG